MVLLGAEPGEEIVAGDLPSAEGREMRRELLDVDPCSAASAEVLDEVEDAEFRAVGDEVEHALTGEDGTGGHAIETCDEARAVPELDTVSVAEPMQGRVGGYHYGGDPGAALTGTRRAGAGIDHGLEGGVVREAERGAGALVGFAERAGDVQRVEFENGAVGRADPGDGAEAAGVRPGKNAVAVGGDETLGREMIVEGDEAHVVVGIGSAPDELGGHAWRKVRTGGGWAPAGRMRA